MSPLTDCFSSLTWPRGRRLLGFWVVERKKKDEDLKTERMKKIIQMLCKSGGTERGRVPKNNGTRGSEVKSKRGSG